MILNYCIQVGNMFENTVRYTPGMKVTVIGGKSYDKMKPDVWL